MTMRNRTALHRARLTLEVLEDRCVPAIILVDNPGDTVLVGQTSLRQAIGQATTSNGDDTITFSASVFNNFSTPQTITLGGSQLDLTNAGGITGALTIQGPGANLLSVSGNNASRVFALSSGSATITGLTITGGSTTGLNVLNNGGGVFNHAGALTLTHCAITGNTSGANIGGGGLFNYAGTLTLTSCTISGNTASGTFSLRGGGLLNLGTATLTNCTVSGNSTKYGGGLLNEGTLTLTNCTVSGNSASASGGGLTSGSSPATLINTIVAGNTAPAAPNETFGSLSGASVNNLIVSNPNLSALGNHGGPTQTMLPQSGSLAIGGVPANTAGTPSHDQRGIPRDTTVATDIGAVQTGTFIVNTTADSAVAGFLSLREAIQLATTTSGDDHIVFDTAVFGTTPKTITLGGSQLDLSNATGITGALTIEGPGANLLSIDANQASRVFSLTGGLATLSGLTITGGATAEAGGGLFIDHGNVTLAACTISGNTASNGGGLHNFGGTATLTGCAIFLNTASSDGGGLLNDIGTVTLTNCTIVDNTATGPEGGGGGVYSFGMATLINCTVWGNIAHYGGGIDNWGGTLEIGNTIVAVNTAVEGRDVAGSIDSLGHNLIGVKNGSSGWLQSDQKGTLTAPLDPKVGPLMDHGGPTLTNALLPGSKAIGKGSKSLLPAGVTTDQRGAGFARVVGKVDIGAYEFPANVVAGTLFVVGTPADDLITIARGTSASKAVVTINGVDLGTFGDVLRTEVRAGDGDDNVSLTNGFSRPATLVGGAGNDSLTGGNGKNVLLGGAGLDALTGGSGRDLLVGGTGQDNLTGGDSDDLLIGGTLTYYDEAADSVDMANIGLVMKEWASTATYGQRIAHLTSGGGLNGSARIKSTTVGQDGETDTVTGGLGRDWFVVSGEDSLTDPVANETQTTL